MMESLVRKKYKSSSKFLIELQLCEFKEILSMKFSKKVIQTFITKTLEFAKKQTKTNSMKSNSKY